MHYYRGPTTVAWAAQVSHDKPWQTLHLHESSPASRLDTGISPSCDVLGKTSCRDPLKNYEELLDTQIISDTHHASLCNVPQWASIKATSSKHWNMFRVWAQHSETMWNQICGRSLAWNITLISFLYQISTWSHLRNSQDVWWYLWCLHVFSTAWLLTVSSLVTSSGLQRVISKLGGWYIFIREPWATPNRAGLLLKVAILSKKIFKIPQKSGKLRKNKNHITKKKSIQQFKKKLKTSKQKKTKVQKKI